MYKKKPAKAADDNREQQEESTDNKQTAANVRLQRDFAELTIPDSVELKANKEDLFNFSFVIKPTDGYWSGLEFEFKFAVSSKYPFEEPRIRCVDKVRNHMAQLVIIVFFILRRFIIRTSAKTAISA